MKYLLEGYAGGLTPNPDTMCNREMKFGVLWDWAREKGFEAIATGHYARREERADGLAVLRGMALLPFWPAANGSCSSPTSVRARWRWSACPPAT